MATFSDIICAIQFQGKNCAIENRTFALCITACCLESSYLGYGIYYMLFFICPYVIGYLHLYDSLHVFLQDDLVNTIGESAALGVSGIVIWGDMNLTQNKVC